MRPDPTCPRIPRYPESTDQWLFGDELRRLVERGVIDYYQPLEGERHVIRTQGITLNMSSGEAFCFTAGADAATRQLISERSVTEDTP